MDLPHHTYTSAVAAASDPVLGDPLELRLEPLALLGRRVRLPTGLPCGPLASVQLALRLDCGVLRPGHVLAHGSLLFGVDAQELLDLLALMSPRAFNVRKSSLQLLLYALQLRLLG